MTQTVGLRRSGVSCHDFAYHNGTVHESKGTNCPKHSSILYRLTGHDILGEKVTYLLSASTLKILESRRVQDDIKTLLQMPRTTVILLVPVKFNVHLATLRLARLPKAAGSNLRTFPFDPLSTAHDEDVAQCIRRGTKVEKVNGYVAFDEDGESRKRIAVLVKLVNG